MTALSACNPDTDAAGGAFFYSPHENFIDVITFFSHHDGHISKHSACRKIYGSWFLDFYSDASKLLGVHEQIFFTASANFYSDASAKTSSIFPLIQ